MFVANSVSDSLGLVEVSVVVDGQPLPIHQHPYGGRYYVAGVPGAAYTLRVKNLHTGRIEVVSSVDGRNTQDDEPGDVTSGGLTFNSNATGSIDGWRTNERKARQFIFGAPDHSVAVQATDEPNTLGVIGFAAFTEMVTPSFPSTPLYPRPHFESHHLPGYEPCKEMTLGGGMGTGIGQVIESPVGRTRFTRSSNPPSILAIGYDTEAWLREQGIMGPALPNPFPGRVTGYARYVSA